MAVDADGAYRAYHPNDRMGLDSVEHAGYPGNWWALTTDTGSPRGRPIHQGKSDPAPGFYVSMTSLFDASITDERNPRRFVDAVSVPYIVLPPQGFKYAKLGDFATVVNLRNGKVGEAIIADESAPELPMGEGSIALARTLGIDPDPRNGGVEKGIAYVIYPGSGNGKPRALAEIVSTSRAHFPTVGRLAHAAWLPELATCCGGERDLLRIVVGHGSISRKGSIPAWSGNSSLRRSISTQ